jgi:Mg2+/Co2+ transporter CorB
MSTVLWLTTTAILVLLFMSAFFSGSETALTAVSKARMLQMEKSGDSRAGIVGHLIEDRERLIGALLLGNNLVNILAASLATSLFLTLFGQAGVAYATLVMTAVVLVFAEVLPKTLAIGDPDRFSRVVAPIVRLVVALFAPFVIAVQVLIGAILKSLGASGAQGRTVFSAAEEIRGQLDLLHAEGMVLKAERDRLGGLLDLGELEVADIMVHRTSMISVDGDDPPEKIIAEALASPHTRLPVWEDEPENIVGVLHVKDLLRALQAAGGDAARVDVKSVVAEPWFVPETTLLSIQLNAFLRRKAHLALVVDEYGAVQGLVTLEDIIEEIVGEIADEHDIAVQGIRPQPDGSIEVDGGVPIRDINRAIDWDLPDEEATTIAGLVIHEAGVIPEPGQDFAFHGYRVSVLRKRKNRIIALRITPLEPRQGNGEKERPRS